MQRYAHSQLVLSASSSSYGSMTLQTGYTFACGSLNVRNYCWYVCKPGLGHPILTTGQRNGQSFLKMADDSAQEDSDGQGHNPFIVLHARVRSRASTVQLIPGGNAAVQCSKQ